MEETKQFIIKNITAFVINLVLFSVFLVVNDPPAVIVGLTLGTAITMLVCGFRKYTLVLGIATQSVVLILLALNMSWWGVYIVFVCMVMLMRIVFKTAPKGMYFIVAYFLSCLVPALFVAITYYLPMMF